MKHIIFGGFDYAVHYEMDQDAIFNGIDYFVDNNPDLIGTTYLGKEIKHPDALLSENKENIIILIGSIVYYTELKFQLLDMGFEEDKNFIWGISFCGDEKCPRLWRHIEWNDASKNADRIEDIEKGNFSLIRYNFIASMIDYEKTETVMDLGAANGRLGIALPPDIKFIPVDYIRYSEDTIVCDFNKNEYPDCNIHKYNPKTTTIVSVDTIGYVMNWKYFLKFVSDNCYCFILGHHDFSRMNREYRKTHWSRNNALFDYQLILYLQTLGFTLVDAYDLRLKTVVYKFLRKE